MRKDTIILEPDEEEGGYTVTVLLGCVRPGETMAQCIERAREATQGSITDAQTQWPS